MRRAAAGPELVDQLDAALPQTQCTRCGYPDCRRYAEAMADGVADIDRCPPGGAEGVARLAALTGRPVRPLDPAHGVEGPLRLAVIDEAWCIGCTLCLKACPVDCIVGAPKAMHTVIESACTGCELCVPACPVDCIEMVGTGDHRTGWSAWSDARALQARDAYAWHRERQQREARENTLRLQAKAEAKLADLAAHTVGADEEALRRKRAIIEAALARARQPRTGA
ncbi:MAG: electron transport complex subunit RsxB [Ideonella sp.]|nr:electron transport complex subunit RsxB [Ideonella sp.]